MTTLAPSLLYALALWGYGSERLAAAALAVIERDAEVLAAMACECPQLTLTRRVAHCRAALRGA